MNPVRAHIAECIASSSLGKASPLTCIRHRNHWSLHQARHKYLRQPPFERKQHNRCFSTSSSSCGQRQHVDEIEGAKKPQKRKPIRSPAANTSLRRAAVEAGRSRDFVKGTGKRRFIDPNAETKKITAYCAAEQYDIASVARLVKADGYELDPCDTKLYPQVVHIQTPKSLSQSPDSTEEKLRGPGDVFIFPSGTVVAWNVSERVALNIVTKILAPAAENPHPDTMEAEDLEYIEDADKESSEIIGDTIVLGTKTETRRWDGEDGAVRSATNAETAAKHDADLADDSSNSSSSSSSAQRHDAAAVLAQIAFSSALARSTKLGVLENLLAAYFASTRSIPTLLSRGPRLPFTRAFILRKTGLLLSIRSQLNLYSELTDSLPDLFWDSPHALGLERYYEQAGRALDVGVRIRVLNAKLDYAQEIAAVLRERLSEGHGLLLEWLIIGLISVEVGFEILRLLRERREREDRGSMENLLRRYLEAAERERERERDGEGGERKGSGIPRHA
ncbi:hypothetical protein BJ546DRAFT_874720 [Cryomyces antarcticus]